MSRPSGAAVVYLTLGALLARVAGDGRLRGYYLLTALLLVTLIGLTRVYLGVHYPTDVLGGWTAGVGWAMLCWLVARQLQRRGRVERSMDGS